MSFHSFNKTDHGFVHEERDEFLCVCLLCFCGAFHFQLAFGDLHQGRIAKLDDDLAFVGVGVLRLMSINHAQQVSPKVGQWPSMLEIFETKLPLALKRFNHRGDFQDRIAHCCFHRFAATGFLDREANRRNSMANKPPTIPPACDTVTGLPTIPKYKKPKSM